MLYHKYPTTEWEWGGLFERRQKQNYPPPHHCCIHVLEPTGTDLSSNQLGLYIPTLLSTAIPWPSPLSRGRNLSPSLSRLSAKYAAIHFTINFIMNLLSSYIMTMHFIEFNHYNTEATCARHM